MTFAPAVAFTVNNRPGYLAETLDSWSSVRGIEDAHLLFFCEPGCLEAVDMCADVDFAREVTVTVNDRRHGVLGNPWRALDYAFVAADFAILAEEDLIVSPDVLEYFAWSQRYESDRNVLGITTYQHEEQPGGLQGVGEADWSRDDQWHFWVWGTWQDRWRSLIRSEWDFTYDASCGCPPNMRGWDWALRNHLVRDKSMKMIAPSLCRSQHIGEFGGAHCQPQDFEKLLSPSFAGLDVPVQEYREVTPCHT